MLDISKRYGISSPVAVKQKLIELSEDVLEAVAEDAARCRRSVNKQIEAVLTAYYGLDNVNLWDASSARAILRTAGKESGTSQPPERENQPGATITVRKRTDSSKRAAQTQDKRKA